MRLGILGAGPGGYVAAIKAAQLGAEVTVIEDSEVGGTCLNRGCIPTKSIIASVTLYDRISKAEELGIEIEGNIRANLQKIVERKNKVVQTQVKGIKSLFKSYGIDLIYGRGRLISERQIEILSKEGQRRMSFDAIIIATGSRPAEIPPFAFDGKRIINSTDALDMEDLPESILIVGAGVVGCEFAFIFSALGAEVTMVEALPRALSTEDEEISHLLERELKKRKIRLFKEVKVERVEVKGDRVYTYLSSGEEISTEKVLVSAGRTFNSDGIGLEEVGIEKGQKGEIKVSRRMETSVDGIYAVGDVVGGMLLAHVASKEGIVAVKNIMGGSEDMDYSVVPSAIFTFPEIGSVGLREWEARQKGIDYITGHFQFRTIAKAHAIGEISGIIKVVADRRTDRLLGAHIIGPHASELIHEAAVAIKGGLRVKDIAETIHAHPTLSEGLMEAAEELHDEAIHVPKRR